MPEAGEREISGSKDRTDPSARRANRSTSLRGKFVLMPTMVVLSFYIGVLSAPER